MHKKIKCFSQIEKSNVGVVFINNIFSFFYMGNSKKIVNNNNTNGVELRSIDNNDSINFFKIYQNSTQL